MEKMRSFVLSSGSFAFRLFVRLITLLYTLVATVSFVIVLPFLLLSILRWCKALLT